MFTMNTQLIVVRLNTAGRVNANETHGPITIATPQDIRPEVQKHFDTFLKGVVGYVLVFFNGKMWMCERNNIDPNKPYVRHEILYHPLASHFNTSIKV